jgi:hypothetical protein
MWLRELLKPLRGATGTRVAGMLRTPATGNISFDHFVGVLEEVSRIGALGSANAHWAPQSDLCGLHSVQFDFVGRMSRMTEDLRALSSLVGFDVRLPSGREYGWEGNGDAGRLLGQYYTSRSLVNRVSRLYRSDMSVPLNAVYYNAQLVFGDKFPPVTNSAL